MNDCCAVIRGHANDAAVGDAQDTVPGQESGAASGHCGPSLSGDIDAARLALKLPVDQEHRIAPDYDYVGEIVGGKTGNDLGGLGLRQHRHDFFGSGVGAEVVGNLVLVDTGDTYKRRNPGRPQNCEASRGR